MPSAQRSGRTGTLELFGLIFIMQCYATRKESRPAEQTPSQSPSDDLLKHPTRSFTLPLGSRYVLSCTRLYHRTSPGGIFHFCIPKPAPPARASASGSIKRSHPQSRARSATDGRCWRRGFGARLPYMLLKTRELRVSPRLSALGGF
ncbi:uncharacterized protein LAESUDRAFT_758919 [Laetiporus sulphureus 93-53]|uniref:Secreted protein n=1 Tax=Laetiporus sulphureus 93-53 TaxID=1314785 RepID=A0A165EIJ5_9APHY|nr:uncharacterized protein LAESUDRAFT_758919 [Laetiporus sulphureus 93-53]KZT07125.1 hypothetical protein LAESUDRAFT_758919 [Laetiporus sulphureus 93-53]